MKPLTIRDVFIFVAVWCVLAAIPFITSGLMDAFGMRGNP